MYTHRGGHSHRLVQIFALLYVTYIVPLRSGFVDRNGDSLLSVEAGGWEWWVDLVVDLYFFTDLGLTFRTAYWLPDGVMEMRPSAIARNYFSGTQTREVPRIPTRSDSHDHSLPSQSGELIAKPPFQAGS